MRGKLTLKQERFVAEYLVDLNATQAAIRAGYSAKTADTQSSQLLVKTQVADAIARKKSAQLQKCDLTAVRVLEEIRRLAFADLRGLFDEQGNLRPIHSLSDEQAASIASLEVIKRNVTAGDGTVDTIHKLKVWDKTKALEMLAKHFALLVERIDVSVSLNLADRIRAARKRLRDGHD
jgi:phage terminase small subunit